jgi:hypothetical protein
VCSAVAREPAETGAEGVANLSEDNRLAPPGSMLLNLGTRTTPDRVGKPAGDIVRTTPTPARPAASEPSWTRVLATTIKLWVLRARRWQVVAAVAVAAVVTVAALTFSGVFAGTAAPAAPARAAGTPSPAKAVTHPAVAPASLAQTAAATWVADQLSSNAIIACDPALCAVLQAQGVSAGRLMPLKPGSPDPDGATVVVTSASADGPLAGYAPAMIASFGSGRARIDVRAAEPGGATAYDAALRADLAARMSAGSQLLRNNRIHFTAQDAAQLRAGQVDTRLLATLAALSSQYSFTVTAFGDASPGAAALYREVSITTGGKKGTAELASALALVQAQVPPYLPAHAAIVHQATAPATLGIEFAAPSPMGLLTAVLDVDRSPARSGVAVAAAGYGGLRQLGRVAA